MITKYYASNVEVKPDQYIFSSKLEISEKTIHHIADRFYTYEYGWELFENSNDVDLFVWAEDEAGVVSKLGKYTLKLTMVPEFSVVKKASF